MAVLKGASIVSSAQGIRQPDKSRGYQRNVGLPKALTAPLLPSYEPAPPPLQVWYHRFSGRRHLALIYFTFFISCFYRSLRSAKDDTPTNRLLVWDEKHHTVVGGPDGESRSFTLRSDGREIQRYVDATLPKVRAVVCCLCFLFA